MKGEVFNIDLDCGLSDYAAAKHKRFEGYSDHQRIAILATLDAPPPDIASLFYFLEDEAAHYVDLRAAYDLRTREAQKKRAGYLARLKAAIDLLIEAERDLDQPDDDLIYSLAQRRTRIEMQEAELDPFNASEGYVAQLRFFGIGDPAPQKDRQPEHSFVGALCKAFADATGVAVGDVTITTDIQKNPFMRFAWACASPVSRGRFTPDAIAGAARSYRAGNLESVTLFAR